MPKSRKIINGRSTCDRLLLTPSSRIGHQWNVRDKLTGRETYIGFNKLPTDSICTPFKQNKARYKFNQGDSTIATIAPEKAEIFSRAIARSYSILTRRSRSCRIERLRRCGSISFNFITQFGQTGARLSPFRLHFDK